MNIGFKHQKGRSHQRLNMARRAGYLSPGHQSPASPEAASQEWRRVSKHLSRDAGKAGYADPRQYLYQGAWNQGQLPGKGTPSPQPRNPQQETWSRIILTYGTRTRVLSRG